MFQWKICIWRWGGHRNLAQCQQLAKSTWKVQFEMLGILKWIKCHSIAPWFGSSLGSDRIFCILGLRRATISWLLLPRCLSLLQASASLWWPWPSSLTSNLCVSDSEETVIMLHIYSAFFCVPSPMLSAFTCIISLSPLQLKRWNWKPLSLLVAGPKPSLLNHHYTP